MLANLTDALKTKGMWNNTILFFLGDNGAPTANAGSNSEHKGAKFTHWEGGHRVASFVGGPLVAPTLRGQWYNRTVHLVDLHATRNSNSPSYRSKPVYVYCCMHVGKG